MKKIAAIVLAAGKGTRMKSALPKVLHPVAGPPMLSHPLGVLAGLGVERTVVVVGHAGELVATAFKGRGLDFVTQSPQLGTGHAVMCALKKLKGFKGEALILSGDVPLITGATIKGLVRIKKRTGAVLSLISTLLDDPAGYGRVVRDGSGAVTAVVEHKDCTPGQRGIREVNAGIYLVEAEFLAKNIKKLGKANAQGEYYLPDLVAMAVRGKLKVSALTHLEPVEVMGVNNRVELARANKVMRRRVLDRLMLSGVTVVDPAATYVDTTVKVGRDTTVHPGAHLLGETSIGGGCVIEEGVKVIDSAIGAGTIVKSHSVVEESRVGRGVTLGPFARLRPGCRILDRARVGNFVEVKKSVIGTGSKAGHLSYIGDSIIGADVNIGAGTITCNYDGVKKHTTRIEDRAFIGSDTQLVAPVKIGKGAYVGSGTTVTRDVPPGALVTTRAQERVIKGWAGKFSKRKK